MIDYDLMEKPDERVSAKIGIKIRDLTKVLHHTLQVFKS